MKNGTVEHEDNENHHVHRNVHIQLKGSEKSVQRTNHVRHDFKADDCSLIVVGLQRYHKIDEHNASKT